MVILHGHSRPQAISYATAEVNGHFCALDVRNGKPLREYQCGAGANAMPFSYSVKNRQYIAMGCGGNTQLEFKRGNTMFVFALPKS
jgi:alcohol dehydrogenase (cytochrome c)